MIVRQGWLGSGFLLLVSCSTSSLPLGEREGGVQPTGGTSGSAGQTGAGGGTSGTSGAGGSGGSLSECQPTAAVCYGNRPASSPGSECLANVDNTNADRVQFRQTWIRMPSPRGNTSDTVYGVLRSRAQIKLPECYSSGSGGFIQISSWDRSNPDITQQSLTTGYASYSAARPAPPPTGADVVRDGLCYANWSYSYDGPRLPDLDTSRWLDRSLPQPWEIKPLVSQRVAEDFDASALAPGPAHSEGVVYIDESRGYIHGYLPHMYMTILDNPTDGMAIPINAVEYKWKFNDNSFNCMGRFRADKLNVATNCDDGFNQTNPQWGCADDRTCPPLAGFGDSTGPGAGPGYLTGYALIVDLERVYSTTLGSTLCVSFPGQQVSIADGWAKTEAEGGWGLNCRGSPKWNPDLADDAGLPMGDWCSWTNSPATATCHDAYRVTAYTTAQAFKVQEGTCSLAPPLP